MSPSVAPPGLPAGLARLIRPRPLPAPGERCEMCAEDVPATHPHVVDLTDRSLMCCCRACGMLFTDGGAARGRYRTVPDRWLHDPSLTLTAADWDRFQIPVRLAFFFVNSALGRVVALYPGPGGATESELALDSWEDLLAGTALARALTPDVEALLVDRGEARSDASVAPACHLVPIDACYELVGRLRLRWVGFDGGAEAHAEFDRFFATVRERSRAVAAPAAAG
jgi:hypothetical protein